MREPDYQRGDVKLYLGDCRDVLPHLSGVDAVVTDIPYAVVNRNSGGLRNLDKGNADTETFDLHWFIDETARLASTVYVFCGTEQVSELRAGYVAQGMTTRLCVWEKSNPSPMNGEHFWLSSIEACIFARKSGAFFSEKCQSAVWRGPVARNQRHPTQKPTWLFTRLISASVPSGGVVFDPCTGSGTSAISAIRCDCQFIGCELDQMHFDLACERIDRELDQPRIFHEIEPVTSLIQQGMFDGQEG